MDEDGWVSLDEPIDQDIDEGLYVAQGTTLIDQKKTFMVSFDGYKRLGSTHMGKQRLENR